MRTVNVCYTTGWVVDEARVVIIVADDPQSRAIRNRYVDHRVRVISCPATVHCACACFERGSKAGGVWSVRDKFQDAAQSIGAIKCALRPLQYFDALHIERIEIRGHNS